MTSDQSAAPEGVRSPPAKKVEDFHKNADVNKRQESFHHTLGNSRTQASPGDHNHQNGQGVPILDGSVITGSRSTGLANIVRDLLQELEKLGLDDQTVP